MKSSFSLKYTVLNGGWAVLEIGNMEKAVTPFMKSVISLQNLELLLHHFIEKTSILF